MFGAWLKERREEAGITVEAAAASAGVSPTTWRSWEGGGHLPNVRWLPVIAGALGLEVDDVALAAVAS